MTTESSTSRFSGNHENLEHRASVMREKLITTLKQLDKRWNSLFDLGNQVRSHPLPFVVAGSGLALALVGGITIVAAENRRRSTFGYKCKRSLHRVLSAL